MSTVILHDYFAVADGGGRLALTLAKNLPADLGYGFRSLHHPFFESLKPPCFQYDLGCRSPFPLHRQWRLCKLFMRFDRLQNYDTVIYSGFYAPLAIFCANGGKHVYYCHTPPRYVYDQFEFYQERLSSPVRFLLNQFISYYRDIYENAVRNMDVVVTNSRHVQNRIQRYLNINSIIVYPPCDTSKFHWLGQDGFYLSCARLDPLKRVDKVIRAFIKMPDKRLVVASGGSEYRRLRRLARNADNITFTGWISEACLQDLIGRAIATIYIPRDEDFGMSPVESMAAGKPVIGVKAGGMSESVVEGETGLLLSPDPVVEEIIEAIHWLTPTRALSMRFSCHRQAKRFDTVHFMDRMRSLLGRV